MLLPLFLLPLGVLSIERAWTQTILQPQLAVHNITRAFGVKFENLAIRDNGQILTTTTYPNASIYQVDPRNILPRTLIYTVPNVSSAMGIVEAEPGIFYVAAGYANLTDPYATNPEQYQIIELDVRDLAVLSDGSLTRQPGVKRVASLPDAALLNGIALARPDSAHLLIADTFRGLIWNVNVHNGSVGVALNDSTTKGTGDTLRQQITGVNGLKVLNDTMYWTSTGASELWKVPINEFGHVPIGQKPWLVASNISCDDFVLDTDGTAYVAAPADVIWKVQPDGSTEIIAGTYNSTSSSLVGPSAIRFGRLASDKRSLYVTTNAGIPPVTLEGTAGVSRLDLG